MIARIHQLLCLICFTLLLAACNTKINKTNFDQIQTGMTLQDVVAILGDPSSSATLSFGQSSITSVRWENRNGSITVQFINGTVKIKQYIEGVTTPRKA